MLDPEIFELINKEIDGVNTPAESERLQSYIVVDAEARRAFEELSQLSNTLAEVASVEPDANLKKMIMNAVPAKLHQRETRQSWLAGIWQLVQSERRLRYAAVFVTGLAAGALLFTGVSDWQQPIPQSDLSNMTGTLATVGNTIPFSTGIASGSVLTQSSADEVLVVLDIMPTGTAIFTLAYPPASARFAGLAQDQAAFLGTVEAEIGNLRIITQSQQKTSLKFSRLHASAWQFQLKIIDQEKTVFDQELVIDSANERQ